MDWDLWGPPNDIAAEESGAYKSQCDFYFGYGFDVIEEEALNEKYCVQVLRILIKKADIEILELEQDLLALQTELALVENEDWPDICGNALREEIDILDVSIKDLRSKDKNDVEVRLQMYTQPVETMDEILKALFRNYTRKKDEQFKDAIVLGSSSDTPRHATNYFDKEKRLTNCNLETITSEKTKDCSSNLTEHGASLNPSFNLPEKKTGDSKIFKPASANIKDFTPQPSEVAPDCSDEKKSLSFAGSSTTGKSDVKEHGLATKDEKLLQSSSSKSAYQEKRSAKPVKVELTENSVSNSTLYALENAVVLSYEDKPGYSDSTATEEVEGYSSISTADVVISSSFLKPIAKKTDLRKPVKPASITVKDFGSSANGNAASHSTEIKFLVMSDLRVIGNEEATKLQSRGIGKTTTPSSSLNRKAEEIILKQMKYRVFLSIVCINMLALHLKSMLAGAVIKNVSAEALRCAAGLSGRKDNSDCALVTFKQANCSNSDVEQKLCEFFPKAAQRRTVKESNIAAVHDLVSSKSPWKTNGKKKTPLIAKLRETDLNNTENCALTSLLEMQDHEGKNAANLQPEEEKPMLVEVQMTEISADDKKSNLKLSSNPQREKGMRNIKSNPPILHEIGFSKLILNSSSSSISESSKKRKSGAGLQSASLNHSLSGKITKKAVRPDKSVAKEHGAVTDDTLNSVSEPESRKKVCVNIPHLLGTEVSSVKMDVFSSLGDTIDGAGKDDLSAGESSSICDSSHEVVASRTSAKSKLRDLRVPELRTIAGRLNLSKFRKLRKELLLDLIAERLANG